jgi:hypothetical protein
MRSSSARRELAFVLALACAGLALVLVVVFAPWYPSTAPVAEVTHVKEQVVRVIEDRDGGVTLTR